MKYKVTWTATFETVIEVDEGENVDDVANDIDPGDDYLDHFSVVSTKAITQ